VLLVAWPIGALVAADADQPWQTVQPADGQGPTARHESGLAAVSDRLWLFGGRGLRPVEAWSPGSNRWRDVTPMPVRLHHFQPAVVGQSIFAIGAFVGNYPNETPVAQIYRFDIASESWSVVGEVPADRRRGGAGTAVQGEWIYLIGGNTLGHNGGAVPWLDRYRPADGTWERLADAPHARDHFSAAFAGGRLVAAAGRTTDLPNPFDGTVAPTDVYDPIDGSWQVRAAIPTVRAGTLAVGVCDEVIVAGGEDTGRAANDQVEAYDVVDDSWRTLQPLSVGRHSGGGAMLGEHFHLVAGSDRQGGGGEVSTHEFLALPLDSDCDGLSDDAELGVHGSDPQRTDTDADGLDDAREVELGTDPANADTDGDRSGDPEELSIGTDPLVADSDGDTLGDGDEGERGTDPLRADSDDDELDDGREVALGTDPLSVDSDQDGLDDARELMLGTDPLDADSDGDRVGDGAEVAAGTDPLVDETAPVPPPPTEPAPREPPPSEPGPVTPEPQQPPAEQPAAPVESSGGGGAPGAIWLMLLAGWRRLRRVVVHHCPQSPG